MKCSECQNMGLEKKSSWLGLLFICTSGWCHNFRIFLEKNLKLELLNPKTATNGQRASPYWKSQTCEIRRKNDPKLCPNYETDKYRCRPPRKFYPKFDINNECCPKVIS